MEGYDVAKATHCSKAASPDQQLLYVGMHRDKIRRGVTNDANIHHSLNMAKTRGRSIQYVLPFLCVIYVSMCLVSWCSPRYR